MNPVLVNNKILIFQIKKNILLLSPYMELWSPSIKQSSKYKVYIINIYFFRFFSEHDIQLYCLTSYQIATFIRLPDCQLPNCLLPNIGYQKLPRFEIYSKTRSLKTDNTHSQADPSFIVGSVLSFKKAPIRIQIKLCSMIIYGIKLNFSRPHKLEKKN